MGLLATLNLKPTKRMVAAQATKAPPAGAADRHAAVAAYAARPEGKGEKQGAGAAADEVRAKALEHKAEIDRRYKEAYQTWARYADAEPKLKKLVAAAQGPTKAALVAKQQLLGRKIAEAKEELDQLAADAHALESPGTTRAEYVDILSRIRSGAKVAKATEVDLHADDLSRKVGEKHETRTTSSYGAGKSVVEKVESKRTWSVGGGVTSTSSRETSKTVSGGVERGDGKVGGVLGGSRTGTDASGTAVSRSGKGKGGLVAGKDGYGGFLEGEGGVKSQRKGGFTTGAVAGLNANVVCNIREPKGDPKKPETLRYPLELEVNLGASLAFSAGQDKEDAAGKGSVEGKLGKTVFMKRTYLLTTAEARGYVGSLAAASGGGTAAATHNEFAIIATGVKKGWPRAQQMFLAMEGMGDLGRGESAERGGGSSVAVKGSVNIKAVSLEAGVEERDDHSTKAARDDQGKLSIEQEGSHTSRQSGKLGINVGVVGGSFGGAHTAKTSSGRVIRLTSENDPDGKLDKELKRCRNDAEIDAFAKRHPEAVESTTVGRAVDDSRSVWVSVAGADAQIGVHHGVDESVTRDKDGRLKSKKVVGKGGVGGSAGVGNLRIGDNVEDEAAAEIDGAGNATADLSRKRTATDAGKWIRAHVPLMGDKDKEKEKKKGLLKRIAGGDEEQDTDTHQKSGLKLANKDLDMLGKLACSDWRKWQHAESFGSPRYIEDWEAAGNAIRAANGERGAVAEALARFIGGDPSGRLDMVTYFLRQDGRVSTGKRYEFPDGMEKQQKVYEDLVVNDCEAEIAQIAKKEGAQKAGEEGKMFDALEALYPTVVKAQNFSQPAVRAEMMAAIDGRKTKVLAEMRRNAGNATAEQEKAAQEAEYHRILKSCVQYESTQGDLFGQINEWYAPGRFYNNDKIVAALQQLRNLYATWTPPWQRAAELGKAIGKPEATWGHFRPNVEEFEKIEKKVRF